MSSSEVGGLKTADGFEIRAMPTGEPLASCSFAWAQGWSAITYDWYPPALGVLAQFFSLTDKNGRLDVYVARFGAEIDGMAFVRRCWPKLSLTGWWGLPVACGRMGDAEVRILHGGPAVHVLVATGSARRLIDAAAASFQSLAGQPIPSEPLVTLKIAPLQMLRLASWTVNSARTTTHGHQGVILQAQRPNEHVGAELRIRVVDRRIHVGVDPMALIETERAAWVQTGLELGMPEADPGPDGAASGYEARFDGQKVVWRTALRQYGPAIVLLTGLWPTFKRAPVTFLNARRHFDIILTTAKPS